MRMYLIILLVALTMMFSGVGSTRAERLLASSGAAVGAPGLAAAG
jgi:hypothetical protein